MEPYIKIEIANDSEFLEAVIAELAEAGFEGFVETELYTEAFIPQSLFDEAVLEELLGRYGIDPSLMARSVIEPQNWNAQWESDFEPITIGDAIMIRAPFHQPEKAYPLEIVIQPKNTFGTGHHETTQLMLELMLETDFRQKTVFDFGCGTGVLGIMASKLGAGSVLAIDIDDWSAENIEENTTLNKVTDLRFIQGTLDVVPQGFAAEIILANINKNILMQSFEKLSGMISPGGHLLISGFYDTDLAVLAEKAGEYGFRPRKHLVKNSWVSACLVKATENR